MSVLPSSMIFDDHDVRDDWNTSRAWRADIQQTDWWAERIIGGLSSYWVYQHLGNLAPAELAANELYQQVRGAGRRRRAAAARVRRRTPTGRPTAPRAPGGPTVATSGRSGCW